MAHGTPVLTSNTSSIPEVVGNAAVLVNPENVFEMMRALQRVLLDKNLRDKMRQRGYEQVKKFSWDRSAAEVLAGYEEIAGLRPVPVPVTRVQGTRYVCNALFSMRSRSVPPRFARPEQQQQRQRCHECHPADQVQLREQFDHTPRDIKFAQLKFSRDHRVLK